MKLSKRLQAVADMVAPKSKVADIGCDHAYISIDLMRRKIADSVIALDVNEGPLRRAAENIEKFLGKGTVETRLSNGAGALVPGEVDTLMIGGMGGGLINRILKEGEAVAAQCRELILQPQSEIADVRRYLHEIGFSIQKENMVIDEGKFYVVIKAVHKAEPAYRNEIYYLYGACLLNEKNPVLGQYLKLEYQKKKQVIERLSGLNHAEERLRTLSQELLQLKEALHYMASTGQNGG